MLTASNGPYRLIVERDPEPINPRVDYDNFGTMICYHNRYTLGDPHKYQSGEDFMVDILADNMTDQHCRLLVRAAKEGRLDNMQLYYDRSDREWRLACIDGYDAERSYPAPLNDRETAMDLLERMDLRQLDELAQSVIPILPLYLYDHGGITMRTTSFGDPWDSGLVGWIYADRTAVEREFGGVSASCMRRAREMLQSELENYDLYLQGECYGYRLLKHGREVESCWGFLGQLKDVTENMQAYLPQHITCMFDRLDEQTSVRKRLRLIRSAIPAAKTRKPMEVERI